MSPVVVNDTIAEVRDDDVLQKINASELICEVLVNFGVTHIFGGHGGAIVGLVDAIVAHPKLTWVYNRCEVNSVQAAMAYAKLHNRLGCCVATSGPGAGHLLSGLVDADQDRVPLLCITGLKSTGSIRHSDFQDIDQAAIFRMSGIGLSESVSDINQLIPLLRNALYLAVSTYRCSHLAIPIDVQLGSVTAPKLLNFHRDNLSRRVLSHASDEQIRALAMTIIKERIEGRHMVIFCGWRAYYLGDAIESLAETLQVPIITSFDGKGCVNEDNPRSFGVAGIYGFVGGGRSQSVLENCDVVIGVCMPDLTKAVTDKSGMQIRRLIQIESEIMTGDSMRFIAVHSFESHDLAHSLALTIDIIKDEINVMKICFQRNKEKLRHKSQLSVFPSEYVLAETKYCHPGVFFSNMSSELKEDAILCADIGDNALWMASGIKAQKGQRTLTSEHMGIMGFALNAGLAASCSTGGNRQVLVVAGDGGFQMSSNELATLKDHQCTNVLVVVVVNGRLGRVNNETWGAGVRADGCSIGSPDFVKLFEAHGYPDGKHLTTSDDREIQKVIRESWELAYKQGLAVIVVHQDPETHPTMHKISAASGLLSWERYLKEMNKERSMKNGNDKISINAFNFSNETIEKLNRLEYWVDSHTSIALSKYIWVGSSFLSMSPAKIFQHQLSEMNPDAPEIFFTDEEKDEFDKDFWRILMTSFSSEELFDICDKGISNGYSLRLQILVLPKNTAFKLHAHPNVELSIGMQGKLYEYKLTDYSHPKRMLERVSHPRAPPPSDDRIKDMMDQFEKCMVIEEQGDHSQFVERLYASQGQCCANSIGSVHQSFSGKEHGALLFLLWSGCHCNIKLTNVKNTKGRELLREV